MGLVAREVWWPDIKWLLKLRFADESKNDGGICSSDKYMIDTLALLCGTKPAFSVYFNRRVFIFLFNTA